MQWWRHCSSLLHHRQLQSLPQRGAQEFRNKARGRDGICTSLMFSSVLMMLSPSNICFSFQHTDAIESLIHSYPKFVSVGSFPCDFAEDRVCVFYFSYHPLFFFFIEMTHIKACFYELSALSVSLNAALFFPPQISLAELLFERGIIHTAARL